MGRDASYGSLLRRGLVFLLTAAAVLAVDGLSTVTAWAGPAALFASPTGTGTTCSSSSPCTFTEALSLVSPGGTIEMYTGTYDGTFSASTAGTSSGSQVTIEPVSGASVTVDGQSAGTDLTVASGVFVTITDITFTGGSGTGSTSSGTCTTTCTGGNAGGAIYNDGGTLTVNGSTFTGDTATGGAADNLCTAGCLGGNAAGAIYSAGGTLTVTDSTLSGNTGTGGATSSVCPINMGLGCFQGNSAGAIYDDGGTASLTTSTLHNNSGAGSDGGGGIFSTGNLTVLNSVVSGSGAGGSSGGGGIYSSGSLTLTNSVVSGNSAFFGGGILSAGGTVMITQSIVSGNSATHGAGLVVNSTTTITQSTVSGNNSSYDSAGILNEGTLTLTNSTVSDNAAAVGGGGIDNNGGTVTVMNSTLSGNSGDGFDNNAGTADLTATLLAGNGPDCVAGISNVTDDGYNIDDDGSCGFSSANHSTSDFTTLDSYLGPLVNNDGTTDTVALLGTAPKDPAIDVVTSSDCPSTDQRGDTRTAPCDIGAYDTDTQSSAVLYVAPGASTTNGDTSCSDAIFSDPASAIEKAAAGTTIDICPGTYQEYLEVASWQTNLTLNGIASSYGSPPVIVFPQSANPNTSTLNADPLVDVDGATGATIQNLEISGPYYDSGCEPDTALHYGIYVGGGGQATINNDYVSEIRSVPSENLNGCQDGIAVGVGNDYPVSGHTPADTGTATVENSTIENYQKVGVLVDATGSRGNIQKSFITGIGPTTVIASNGVEVDDGAVGNVNDNDISANQYTPVSSQGSGVLLYNPGANVIVQGNTLSANDIGIYAYNPGTGLNVENNTVANDTTNPDSEGIQLDDTSGASVSSNAVSSGYVGIDVFDGTTDSTLQNNQVTGASDDGILDQSMTSETPSSTYTSPPAATANTYTGNTASGSGNFDCQDFTAPGGSGTAGTHNTWTTDVGAKSSPAGICSTTATAGSIAVYSGNSQTATVGTNFAKPFEAIVKDSHGNPVSGATVTFTAPSESGPSGTFGDSGNNVTTAKTGANGVAIAGCGATPGCAHPAPFTANHISAGPYSVKATVGGVATPATFTEYNAPGPVYSVSAYSGTPQSTKTGTAFSKALEARPYDKYGNVVYSASVTFTAPSSGASCTFSNGKTSITVATNSSTRVASATCTANGTKGSYSVTATVSGASKSATFSLTNTS